MTSKEKRHLYSFILLFFPVDECDNIPSENLMRDQEEMLNPIELRPVIIQRSIPSVKHKRFTPSSHAYHPKLCMQLQITISLITISISFIFCTLPNCLSTIMIETYKNNDQVRNFWQAMNYLSLVPLLITHSVNVIFYYASSNMFRNRFREIYLRESSTNKQVTLKTFFNC